MNDRKENIQIKRYFWKNLSCHPCSHVFLADFLGDIMSSTRPSLQTLVFAAAFRDEPVMRPAYKLPSNPSRWNTQEREDTFFWNPDHRLSNQTLLCLWEPLLWVQTFLESNVFKKTQTEYFLSKECFCKPVFPMLSPVSLKKVTCQNRDWASAVRLIFPALLWKTPNGPWQPIHHCFLADRDILEIRSPGAELVETVI